MSSLRSPVTIALEVVATRLGSESRAGTVTWATIMASTPASIACLKGGNSTASRRRSGCHRSEEHTSELQSHLNLVCRLLLEKKNKKLKLLPIYIPTHTAFTLP